MSRRISGSWLCRSSRPFSHLIRWPIAAHFSSRRSTVDVPSADCTTGIESPPPTPLKTTKARHRNKFPSTFDPRQITVKDMVDFSGVYETSMVQHPHARCVFFYTSHRHSPWPSDARGFLYFHRPPPAPHVASGELRFRIPPPGSPLHVSPQSAIDVTRKGIDDVFSRGSDLPNASNTAPWALPLLALRHAYGAVYQNLVNAGLVDDISIRRLVAAAPPSLSIRQKRNGKSSVHTVAEPFVLDLSQEGTLTTLLDPDVIQRVILRYVTHTRATGALSPYSGVALVRFELQPAAEAGNNRIAKSRKCYLVLRLVKYLVPPDPCDSLRQPEGELLRTLHADGREYIFRANARQHLPPASIRVLEELYLR